MNRPRFALFDYGFRPFFLVCGLFTVLAMCWWIHLYHGGRWMAGTLPGHLLHGHEMLFGFVGAAIGGFLLTAVPAWTNTQRISGRPLLLLVLAWLAGRCAFALVEQLPWTVVVVAELLFVLLLLVAIAAPILGGRSRALPMLLLLLAYAAADLVFLRALAAGDAVLAQSALRGAMGMVLLLLTIIGGRIIPAFTANHLRARGMDVVAAKRGVVEVVTVVSMALYVVALVWMPTSQAIGLLAAAAALAHAWRMAGWGGHRSLDTPIVWVLHLAYLWLPVGLALHALDQLAGVSFAVYWMHALGAGAMGGMILAVMTRAALGHTGRALVVSRFIVAAYVLHTVSVVLRVFGPTLLPLPYALVVTVAGVAWVLAWLLFVIVYAPILLLPRVDGKPG